MTDTRLPDAATATGRWWLCRYGPDDQAGALNEITPQGCYRRAGPSRSRV